MVHIVFDQADADALGKSFELDDTLNDTIIVVDEDWSVGPLLGTIDSQGVTTSRAEWLAGAFGSPAQDADGFERIVKYLNENPEADAWIWIAPNARDVCGYYHLVSGLEKFKGRIYTLWLNNLPFINDKGQLFYPVYLREIPAKEFVKAKRLAQPVSGAVFETDPDEWKKLQRENKLLRVLEGAKKIAGRDETFFDKQLFGNLHNDWQKNGKVIQPVMAKEQGAVSRSFLVWRLRELIGQDQLEGRGDWPGSEQFDIRKKVQQSTSGNE